jgi:di/tripeptidase
VKANIGKKVIFSSGSTDSNIPHSLGIASLCIGSNTHAGIHTREEWVDKESMKTGLLITLKTSMSVSGVKL